MTDNVTLLLVDDLEANLVAMAALLRGPGLHLLMARSGEEALELLLAHDVALALVDVQMPGMDGFELAELMRGSERTKHVPIVFVTAGAHDRKRMFRGYDSGAVDFLYKPIEPHILTNKVNVFVELFRQKKALARVSALQSAIFNSANFSSIATDAEGVIQIFNVGAERMLGYSAAEVMNKITPADISDPQEVVARAKALSVELATPITPGFEALVFKASRGIEDIYELTYIRKDGSRFPAVVSVTALRDAQDAIIGYLLIGTDNTARKQAEEALLRAGALQRAIFNSANFSSIATDAEGVIQIFNVGAERMLGYSAAEVMNKITPADISDPQEVVARAQALSVELATPITPGFEALVFKASRGIEDIYELTYIRKDGSRFPAVVSVTALRDAQEAIIGYLLIGTDNTARKQASQYVRSLIEASLDPLVTISAEGKITDVNEGSIKATGIARGKLIGTDFSDYFTEPEKARNGYQQVFAKGFVTDYPLTIRHKDGRLTDVLYNASVYRDVSGNVLGVFAAARDVTARKQAEELQSRLGAIVSSADDGILSKALNGVVTTWNASAERLFGYTAEEIIGNPNLHLTPPDLLHEEDHILEQILAGKAVKHFETQRMTKDGRRLPVSLTISPINDAAGNIIGASKIVRDITERKQVEEALIEAKEHAEAASKAKDNFLAALSHELRTPLTPVLMTATALACDPTLPAEAREQLDMMRRNIELEARLIDDLLDLTHVTHGKMSLAPVVTDLHAVLGHTHEIIRSDAQGKRVQIVFSLEAARHHALVDPTRMQQVFWNLLKNAVKFTPGGGCISVSTVNDADGRMVISVKDNGIGMSAGTLPHIFNAFEQGAIAGQHRYGGLGMGLAISQAIVTAHDGAIRAESEGLHYGSNFTVELLTSDAPAASAPTTKPAAVPTQTLKLLIVEDHEATRQVMQRLLTIKGHRVTTAGSVQEALAIHGTERFDAVISDLGLPDGSGLELMRELQRQRPVPGIALSGYGMEEDLLRTEEAGFFAHLVKPVNFDQLRQLIDQIPHPLP